MSGPKVVIEFVALLQTDDLPNGLSIEITPKTFILHNLDNLLLNGFIDVPLNVKIRSLEKVNGGEFFQGFSQINDKSTYQYQIPLTANGGDGHKAIKASFSFPVATKSTSDVEKVLMQLSKFEEMLDTNRNELSDMKEAFKDMVYMSQPPSHETIESENSVQINHSNFIESIISNVSRNPNPIEKTFQETISELKKRDEAYGEDAERHPIFSDPGDKIWSRTKPNSRHSL